MNVPLDWLKDYVKLPKSEVDLTNRLTMIGHMLDKRKIVHGNVVIDLELRGNRADMFGMIGVARDIAAVFETPLTLPKVAKLPKTNAKSPLIRADASIKDAVKRYLAIKLEVSVAPSPAWLTKRLIAYGIDPINNVVDVTNYVMVETGHPMHAFDADKLNGTSLRLRRAAAGEKFETIQQGTTVTLTTEDIAICDDSGVQCLTCIGGAKTKVNDNTTSIILETAVYDGGNCRRTARRHKIATEGGGRHEKHQDPEELPFALARAVQLLEDIAHARVLGEVSDYYPNPVPPTTIVFNPASLTRLTGIVIPNKKIIHILRALEFGISMKGSKLIVTVPSFRTDVKQEADIVEEVIRIYGYEHIPVETLSGELPSAGTPAHIVFEQNVRQILHTLQVNEVITSTLIENALVPLYQQQGVFAPAIRLVNAPDSDTATLRPTLLPNLVNYAKRSIGFRQKRIALFEIGNTYKKEKKRYLETNTLGLILHGELTTTSWNKKPRPLTFYDIKGIIEGVLEDIGVVTRILPGATHPSMDPQVQGTIHVGKTAIGTLGKIHPAIADEIMIPHETFVAEVSLAALYSAPKMQPQPYIIASTYPPFIEDITFTTTGQTHMGEVIDAIVGIDRLIQSAELIDVYENNRTIRITYIDPEKTLTATDIKPIHDQIVRHVVEEFEISIQST